MKRIRLILCALILMGSTLLQAAPVSKDRALEVAKLYFAAQPATKAAGDVQFIWDGEDIATKTAVQPAFYVFGRDGGGFVIVAGDDNVQPILALSDRNEFKVEGMPDNVKWWMERIKAHVRATNTQTADVRKSWEQYTPTKSGLIDAQTVLNKHELLTPEWGQGSNYYGRQVFNSKCPMDGEKYSVTGCVATAVSEVLVTLSGLYAMPTHPLVDQVEPYSASSASRIPATWDGNPYVFTNEPYDWDNLRKLVNKAAIWDAINAGNITLLDNMDKLLADIGAMMHASYSSSGTGAVTGYTPDTMIRYMGINKAAHFEYASSYSRYQWEQKLKDELDQRPIIYRGTADVGGHAFVFDGYGTFQNEDVFHVNFGWTGSCNGYYYEYFLATDDDPSTWNFSTGCGAAFDFYPDPSSSYPKLIMIETGGMQYVVDGNPVPSLGEGGNSFSLSGWIWNEGRETYDGKLKLVLLDKLGNIKDDDPDPIPINWVPNNGYPSYTFTDISFTQPLSFGDAVAIYYTTDDDMTVWAPVVVDGSAANVVSRLPVFPVAFIKTENSYSAGEIFELALMNHDKPYGGTVWTITNPDGTQNVVEQAIGAYLLSQSGTYKIEAAVAETGGSVKETIVAYITVN